MRSCFKRIIPVALVLLFSVSTTAFCAPPNAGTILREQQPQRQLPMELPPSAAQKKRPRNVSTTLRHPCGEFSVACLKTLRVCPAAAPLRAVGAALLGCLVCRLS
ncbi:MAG: hypothetical protein P4L43_04485, partial [Syntrophobacteraceae bacterium]|nr:hypothetical protein [Syntrophobacteraceae bacterium]